MFVVAAKRNGADVTLIVDSNTLKALELAGTSGFLKENATSVPETRLPELH
jgi:hypothetical protein